MPRSSLHPFALAAATALVAGAAMAESGWRTGAAQVSPEDRPSFATGRVGCAE